MKVLDLDTIKPLIDTQTVIPAIEEGFKAYSAGKTTVPPVGLLKTDHGTTHIKYGYIHGESCFVIKIASSYHGNVHRNISTGSGMMMVFDAHTGFPLCLLSDEGFLTDARTAMAGAICARHLAPDQVEAIGIVGTGIQARMQAEHLKDVTACRRIMAWGRDSGRLSEYQKDMSKEGFDVRAESLENIGRKCRLIVTTTPSEVGLLKRDWIQPGTHITAVGADTPGKQELDIDLVIRADLIICDSLSQCLSHGEVHKAAMEGVLDESKLVELGHYISENSGPREDDRITIADLTGVAVQDIQIAKSVYLKSLSA